VIGAIDLEGTFVLEFPDDNVTGLTMAGFLRRLVRRFPNDNHCIFIDNAPTHTSRVFKAECAWHQVTIVWNASYSPQYCGLELVWHQMKQIYRANVTRRKLNR